MRICECESMRKTFEEVKKMAEKQGIDSLTQEEYEAHVSEHWTVATALRRVSNARKKKVEDADKKIEEWTGYPLGGRDFIHKIRDSDDYLNIEDAKSQKIPFLRDDGAIVELTQWGHFKGTHGRKSVMQVEVRTKKGAERTFVDNVITGVMVQDQKISMSALLAKAISVDDLTEQDKNNYIIVHGEMGKFEQEPKWENGEKVDVYPMNYNKVPCLQFSMKGPGGKTFLRCQLAPTKYGRPLIAVEDFEAMMDAKGIEEYAISFGGHKVIVVGWLRRFDPQAEVIYANLMATAIFPADVNVPTQDKIDAPKAQPKTPPAPPAPTKDEKPKDAPASGATAEKLKITMEKVRGTYDILGNDLTLESFKEVEGNTGIADKVLAAIIEKVKKEHKDA